MRTKKEIKQDIGYMKRQFKNEEVDILKKAYMDKVDEIFNELEAKGMSYTDRVQEMQWNNVKRPFEKHLLRKVGIEC